MKFGSYAIDLKRPVQMPLIKNAFFLILTSGSTSLLGFVFWILVARIYPPSQVGLAIAIISASSLLGGLSKLGLDFGLIRYLPITTNKKEMLNSTMTITGTFSILLAIIFLAGLKFWS
ncbi:MAG: oligosaccharide flippase family protein, partial [Dehalococcoidales bacterium]|nr:oligosaccharide flippase family protein [Dehalococcoidales bacterium]